MAGRQLQDQPVADLAGQGERLGPVGRDPALGVDPSLHGKRNVERPGARPTAVGQLADHVDRLAQTSTSVVGFPLSTRTAESPRPMPHTVRLPYISLSVAKSEAVTVQSLVAGW